ncbi:MAG: sialate O-acetylesterase [bacterium]|nr:sialate O-acetylesterase [bacterium]
MKRCLTCLVLAFCLAAIAGRAPARVELPAIISDNMVLQRGAKVPIWGKAADGEKVTVEFQGKKETAQAREGHWMVTFGDLQPGGPFTMTVAGENTIEIKNILVGDVWLSSGQSNMAFMVAAAKNGAEEIARSANPKIRLFQVERAVAVQPAENLKGQWLECAPDALKKGFSAVAYFFARDLLAQRPEIPALGMINSSVGGTPIESWLSRPTLESSAGFREAFTRDAAAVEAYPQLLKAFERQLAVHPRRVKQARAQNKPVPRRPVKPQAPETNTQRPAVLYNAMIAPLEPFALKGVLWYQGEGNAARAYQYQDLLTALITTWRKAFRSDFTFLNVQLASFDGLPDWKPGNLDATWPWLRESQLKTAETVPNSGMAVIIDAGEKNDIHPKNKQVVAERLALAARALAYGEKIVYSGPIYKSMKREGAKIVLSFDHVGGGLVARAGDLKTFAIAGADERFVPAQAKIEGDTVVVWSDAVTDPVAVRYAWLAWLEGANLYNKDGLPASPFRTDKFTDPTRAKDESKTPSQKRM